MQATQVHTELVDFVYYENGLLDDARYQEWYELFDDDGVYWVPVKPEHTQRDGQVAIALETRMLLALRIERLAHPRAFSLQPRVRGMHVVQRPEVLTANDEESGHARVRAQLVYIEHQSGQQVVLGARVTYTLRRTENGLRIVEKRVDLLNSDAFLPAIQLFI